MCFLTASCRYRIQTIPKAQLGRLIGYLHPDQEPALAEAINLAFDLDTL